MRRTIRTLIPTLAIAGLAACQAFAQQYDRPYGDRDYARQDRSLFDRARADLDRASNYQYSSRADRKRFDEARRDLFDFAARFEQGRYEKHELDHAIDRVENVVSHNSLNPRDRGALDEDLRRMRDYRNFRDRKEYRDYNSGRR
ncbi:MAG TPA: hypothetical protein VFC21_09585 [Bryobacteraceae bacterium]|nr:hypothetical protein [Bryobacteraceae bacterium]